MSELIPNTPEKPTPVEAWAPLETGLVVTINSVHLGRIEKPAASKQSQHLKSEMG